MDWAIEHLENFVQITKPKNGSYSGIATTRSFPVVPRDQVLEEWVIVEKILDLVHPKWRDKHFGDLNYEFRAQRDAALHAVTLLKARSELEQNLGTAAPSVSLSNLHPWIWDAASTLWLDGHLREAIQAAATAIDLRLQALLDRSDCVGIQLVREAFSTAEPTTGKPRIRVQEQGNADTTRSVQNGVKALGEACFLAVRNPMSHTLDEVDEELGLEYLAIMSLFCRYIESSEIVVK